MENRSYGGELVNLVRRRRIMKITLWIKHIQTKPKINTHYQTEKQLRENFKRLVK